MAVLSIPVSYHEGHDPGERPGGGQVSRVWVCGVHRASSCAGGAQEDQQQPADIWGEKGQCDNQVDHVIYTF